MNVSHGFGSERWKEVAGLFLVPALHPLLIPVIGVPSHLLWWIHVLPVALLTFWFGRSAAFAALGVSAFLVAAGEILFGAGYGVAAATGTVVALTLALTATNVLVVAFAMYARDVTGQYRVLFQNLSMGVVRLDAEGRIVGMNPAAAKLIGADLPDTIVGRVVTDVLRAPALPTFAAREGRGGWTGEVEVGGGSTLRTVHAVMVLAWDQAANSGQLLLADRSTEVMHEQEIERQSKLAALGEALAGVAHELNNPLTVILGHSQLGAMERDPVQTEEMFGVIEHEAVRMQGIVGELLGFSRRTEVEDCQNLDAVLARLARVQRIALGKTITIEEELAWPHPVQASGHKIEQIVLNLISNAAYAVRSGGGNAITISSRPDGDFVEIEVRDDGPGIAPEIADGLFEPFATTKPEGEGTGLGLAISRRLARAWGGDLVARPVEPHGAAFALRARVPS